MKLTDMISSGIKLPINAERPMNSINGKSISGDESDAKGASFSDTLSGFVTDVNTMQKTSAKISESFVKGEAVDIHDVMIAAEQSKTSFQLLMELRNKGLDLYREAMRVQV